MKPRQELHMTIEATPNEVIAMNAAIHYYLTYFHRPTPEFHMTQQLLVRFRQRLVEQLPPTQQGKR